MFDATDIIDNSGLIVVNKTNDKSKKPWEKDIIKGLSDRLKLKGYSNKIKKAYIGHIRRFVDFYEENPLNFNKNDIDRYLLYLLEDQEHSHSYVNQAISAIKFFYIDVLKRQDIIINIPRPKKENKLPEVLSQMEVVRLLNSVENIKHKAILFLIYSSGLRVGEVVRHNLYIMFTKHFANTYIIMGIHEVRYHECNSYITWEAKDRRVVRRI